MGEENKRFCTNCRCELPAGIKFCTNCGTKVEIPVAEMSENETQVQEETLVVAMPETEEIDIHYEDETDDEEIFPEFERYEGEPVAEEEGKKNIGFSIASMICGIMSALCCCLCPVNIISAVAALVLGVIVLRKKYEGKGMAVAGIVTGGIGLLIGIIALVVGVLAFADVDLSNLF